MNGNAVGSSSCVEVDAFVHSLRLMELLVNNHV